MGRYIIVIPSLNDVEVTLTDESLDQNSQSWYGNLCMICLASQMILICQSCTRLVQVATHGLHHILACIRSICTSSETFISNQYLYGLVFD